MSNFYPFTLVSDQKKTYSIIESSKYNESISSLVHCTYCYELIDGVTNGLAICHTVSCQGIYHSLCISKHPTCGLCVKGNVQTEPNTISHQRLVATVDISCDACSSTMKYSHWNQHVQNHCKERIYSCSKCKTQETITYLQDIDRHSCVFDCAASDVKCDVKNLCHKDLMTHHNICHRYNCAKDLRRLKELEKQISELQQRHFISYTSQPSYTDAHDQPPANIVNPSITNESMVRLTFQDAKNISLRESYPSYSQSDIKVDCQRCLGTGWADDEFTRCYCYLSLSRAEANCRYCDGLGSYFTNSYFVARCACVSLPEIQIIIPENCQPCRNSHIGEYGDICVFCNPPHINITSIRRMFAEQRTISNITIQTLALVQDNNNNNNNCITLSFSDAYRKRIFLAEFRSKVKSDCRECQGHGSIHGFGWCYCYLTNLLPSTSCVFCSGRGVYFTNRHFYARCQCIQLPEIRIEINEDCSCQGQSYLCNTCCPPPLNLNLIIPSIFRVTHEQASHNPLSFSEYEPRIKRNCTVCEGSGYFVDDSGYQIRCYCYLGPDLYYPHGTCPYCKGKGAYLHANKFIARCVCINGNEIQIELNFDNCACRVSHEMCWSCSPFINLRSLSLLQEEQQQAISTTRTTSN